jgi:hypothetical protein
VNHRVGFFVFRIITVYVIDDVIAGVRSYSGWTIFADGAFVLTDSIPFMQPSIDLYDSLVAMISPFGAFSRNRYSPFESL